MQQYYLIDEPGVTLTVFHTGEDTTSFDIEHYGTVVVEDPAALRALYQADRDVLEVSGNRHESSATFTRTRDEGLEFDLDGRFIGQTREITVTLSAAQFETLIESLGLGDTSVGYPVEFVNRDGIRDRAE